MIASVSKRVLLSSLLLVVFISLGSADDKKKESKDSKPPSHPAPKVSRPVHESHANSQVLRQNTISQGQGSNNLDRSSSGAQNNQNTNQTNIYHPDANTYHPPANADSNRRSVSTFHPDANTYGNPSRSTGGGTSGRSEGTDFSRPNNLNARDAHDRGRDFHPGSSHPANEAHAFRETPRTMRQFHDKQVAFDRGGHIREVHARDMDIHRDLRGERRFVTEVHGRTVVSMGRNRGYVQQNYISSSGRVYVQRTYVVGGVRYARAYRTYYWHGAVFYHYAPVYYYHPVFYVWAFNPWPRPVYYRWGWASDPWYPAYGYYFAPYPVYPTAAFWLTDYLIAENLRLSYENRQYAEAAAAQQYSRQDPNAPPQGYSQQDPNASPQNYQPDANNPQGASNAQEVQLSPEVKQMIVEEVQRQLQAEQAASANQSAQDAPAGGTNTEEAPAALDPNHRVFVVADNLDVVAEDGNECTLTAGDVILRSSNVPDGTKVAVNVITSKKGDCPVNTNAGVEVNDLQEMQNHFREQLDSGLKTLADKQGQGGLPRAPDTGTTNGEIPAPTPDSNSESELQNQQKNADRVEADVKSAGPGN